MIDRRTITIPRSWAWTVLMGAFAIVGVLVMVGLSMLRQGEDVAQLVQAQRRADLRAEADTKAATIAARERLTVALAEVQRILETKFAAHDAKARGDHDAQMARLAQLLGRPTPRPAPSPAPRVVPRAGGSPAAPPTTAAKVAPRPAPTTTTTCPKRGKRPAHCR